MRGDNEILQEQAEYMREAQASYAARRYTVPQEFMAAVYQALDHGATAISQPCTRIDGITEKLSVASKSHEIHQAMKWIRAIQAAEVFTHEPFEVRHCRQCGGELAYGGKCEGCSDRPDASAEVK